MQFSLGNGLQGKWTVDKIISHSGSKENSLFKILWQAGNVTWLPYHQISHLNALPVYLNFLGISGISELLEGHGKPPADYLQVFSGQLESTPAPQHHKITSKLNYKYRHSTPLILHPFCETHAPFPFLSIFAVMPNTNIILHDAPPIVASCHNNPVPTVTSEKKLPKFNPCTIKHAYIKCLSHTKFLVTDPLKDQKHFFHAGQIANFSTTDTVLCQCKVPVAFSAGYNEFAEIFNTHIEDNPTHFATCDSKTKEFNLNSGPITLDNFSTTEEDIGTKP